MSAAVVNRLRWSMSTDEDGYRTYEVDWLVRTTDVDDGPSIASQASGLPLPGTLWGAVGADFGNDDDLWAFCYPDLEVKKWEDKDNEPGNLWSVGQKFSTKPLKRCQDQSFENPLTEPAKISGSFVKYQKVDPINYDGTLATMSDRSPIQGEQVTWDFNRPTVSITINSATLPLATFAEMMDGLNDSTLWGLPARCVKLSNVSWQKLNYGTCTVYYAITYEFDIDYNTFDRYVQDMGWRVYTGREVSGTAAFGTATGTFDDDPRANPLNYTVIKDKQGENAGLFPLDGQGGLWTGDGPNPSIFLAHYREYNLLLLGVPSSLT